MPPHADKMHDTIPRPADGPRGEDEPPGPAAPDRDQPGPRGRLQPQQAAEKRKQVCERRGEPPVLRLGDVCHVQPSPRRPGADPVRRHPRDDGRVLCVRIQTDGRRSYAGTPATAPRVILADPWPPGQVTVGVTIRTSYTEKRARDTTWRREMIT